MAGRIEAHFQIFGVLAFLAFYCDIYVYLPVVGLILLDHTVRGLLFPESIYGVLSPSLIRSLEHGFWVIFETAFLIWGVTEGRRRMRLTCELQCEIESQRDGLQDRVKECIADTEELLRNSTAHLEAIDRVQGRIEFNPDGLIVDVNDKFAQIMGYSPEELINSHHRILVPESMVASPEYQELWEGLRRGKNQVGEYRRLAKDGSERRIYGTYSVMLDEQGQVFRIIKYAIDQTERQVLQEQLARAQKLESIGQLAAGISHEINTPMQFVSDNIEYLSECSKKLFVILDAFHERLCSVGNPLPWESRIKEMKQLVEECRYETARQQMPAAIEDSLEGVQRAVEIVRAMRQYSHPGAKDKTSVCLNELVEGTVAITRCRWKYVAEMHLELMDNLPNALMLPSEVNQVLLNLVVNAGDAIAERYKDTGEVQGKITIRTKAEEGWVVLEVEDDGCGMSAELQEKIFDPFFTTKEVGKGTGQGLALTHNVIVNQHLGKINVSSIPNQGTVVEVKLPIGAPQEFIDQDDISIEDAMLV